jgi:hypothetical protein
MPPQSATPAQPPGRFVRPETSATGFAGRLGRGEERAAGRAADAGKFAPLSLGWLLETASMTFWIWIIVVVLGIIGISVLVGRSLSRPKGEPMTKHQRMMALKTSGALRHRKSNQP